MATEADKKVIPPFIKWAQREDRVFLTIEVDNAKILHREIKEDSFVLDCEKSVENPQTLFHLELTFFLKIDPSKTEEKNSGKEIFYIFYKTTNKFWPRLINGDKKLHYLKTDFEKWLDPEDSGEDDAEREENLNQLMGAMAKVGEFGMHGDY